jgi:3-hydroxyisobutyrate dehydrogenase-like beta-hydroxyacid dehydrogenase
MAACVIEAGIETAVFDVSKDAMAPLVERGARAATSPADAAQNADVVGIMVRNDEQLLEVTTGEGGALETLARGSVIAVQATVLPETVEQVAAVAAPRGVGVIDAPVTGGVPNATTGTLVTMVGGSDADFERALPVMQAMSRSVVHCGPRGTGAVAKLCNNLVGYLSYQAAYEANLLAKSAGLDTDKLDEILGGIGNITDNMRGYLGLTRGADASREMLARITELAEKDLGHAIEVARQKGIELPGAVQVRSRMARIYGYDEEEGR